MRTTNRSARTVILILVGLLVMAVGAGGYLLARVNSLTNDRTSAFGSYLDLAELHLSRTVAVLQGHLAGDPEATLEAARADYVSFVRVLRPMGGYLSPGDSSGLEWLTVAAADWFVVETSLRRLSQLEQDGTFGADDRAYQEWLTARLAELEPCLRATVTLGERPSVEVPAGQRQRMVELAAEISAGAREYLDHGTLGKP